MSVLTRFNKISIGPVIFTQNCNLFETQLKIKKKKLLSVCGTERNEISVGTHDFFRKWTKNNETIYNVKLSSSNATAGAAAGISSKYEWFWLLSAIDWIMCWTQDDHLRLLALIISQYIWIKYIHTWTDTHVLYLSFCTLATYYHTIRQFEHMNFSQRNQKSKNNNENNNKNV